MNSRIISLSLTSLKVGVLYAILHCSILVARSSWITVDPLFSTAVTIDLIFSIPIIYFLFIRKTSIPKITVVPIFGLGVVTASLVLPDGERQFLDLALIYAVPLVEIFVFAYIAFRVYRTRATFMAEAGQGRDVMERLRSAFDREIQPAFVARVAAFELALIHYSLFRWRSKRDADSFTYHRSDGSVSILIVFLVLLSAETIVLHILLAPWNSVVAWILTAASLYLGLQMIAHLKAMILRPVQITETELLVRCGVLGDAAVDLDSIASIRLGHDPSESEGEVIKLTALGNLSNPNIRLKLDRDAVLNGYYGFSKSFREIGFAVDEPVELAARLQDHMKNR